MAGTLFVVATPIGNLEDLTFRALRTLREVDVIAAEDTRRTRKLLTHYGVHKPLLSVHEHNEFREAPRLVERLTKGESIALVSDAGTPGISDPGATLVRLARQAGIVVTPIPGPSAVTAALSVSGLALDGFVFMGFPPSSGEARRTWLREAVEEDRCVVFFESPHRIKRTLDDISTLVTRQIVVHREISKIHETSIIWAIENNLFLNEERRAPGIGEYVVVIEGISGENQTDINDQAIVGRIEHLIGELTKCSGVGRDEALVAACAVHSVKPSKFRRWVKKAKYSKESTRPAS